MNNASKSRAGAVTLVALGALAALACVSVIGAAATLVVMARDKPASEAPRMLTRAPRSGECAVVAWMTGMIYCFRNNSAEAAGPMRNDPGVVVQARADLAR